MKPLSLFYVITGILGIGAATTEAKSSMDNQINTELMVQQNDFEDQETDVFILH